MNALRPFAFTALVLGAAILAWAAIHQRQLRERRLTRTSLFGLVGLVIVILIACRLWFGPV